MATCVPLLGVGEKQLFSELGVALVPLAGSIHFSSFLLCTGTQLRQWEKTKRAAAYNNPCIFELEDTGPHLLNVHDSGSLCPSTMH